MRSTTSLRWGIPCHLLRIWYKTVVERIILYAAAIWGTNISSQMRRSLLSMQRHQLLICKAYCTTSTAALQVIAGTPPLNLLIELFAVVNVSRLRHTMSLWGQIYIHTDYEHHIPQAPCHPTENNLVNNIYFNRTQDFRFANGVFTDGSKTPGGTGSGFCILSGGALAYEWKTKLASENSVFQSELIAIRAALLNLKNNPTMPNIIYTDSASSLAAIAGTRSRSPIVSSIRDILTHMPASPSLIWVPAHTGIEENERADVLAKEAADSSTLREVPTLRPVSA
ncbi:uncharacterized protein LOC118185236 [Stegodyphus dumicola]|uniref:uncharacterized protein LOC118185236 n=1 Tax=Stegodyphus dumicola TaxID=202533 RepID=UPI0015B2AC24|nr:uncharacterized protein LOC118185236 [Stegodyphus dumicola]